MGDALTDEQLYNLCLERGDDEGSLRFFVSHSSAPVHDLSQSTASISPTTVSTIPPPVLPYNGNSYVSLRPQRRHRSGSRHGSVSSASERLPPEIGAGYEASVSDDMDTTDRDHRSTIRPLPSNKNAVATQRNLPTSPDRGPRPCGPVSRPKSPLYTLRPVSPSKSIHDLPSEVSVTRVDQHGSTTPTPPNAQPPAGLTPNRADDTLTPPALRRHVRSGSDAAAEREQALEASENQLEEADKMWQQQRNGGAGRQDRLRRDNQLTPDVEESLTEKSSQGDSWILVPNDTPRTTSKRPSTASDSSRTSPTVPKDRHRNQKYGGYKVIGGFHNRPHIPTPPRNLPSPLPVGTVVPPSRSTPQAVPRDWLLTSIVPHRQDHKASPVSNSHPWNNRGLSSAKSMNDLRNHPSNLQPGSRRGNQTAVNRPSERGMSIPSNSYGDGTPSASGSYVGGLPKSLEQHRSPVRPLPKQNSFQASTLITGQSPPKPYTTRLHSPPNNGYSNLHSPGGDPYTRPTSALGSSVTSPVTHRGISRPYGNDIEDGDNSLSPSTMSPYRSTAVNGRLGYGREEESSIAGRYGLRLNPNILGSYVSPRSSDHNDPSENPRTPPRSPASPRSPRHSSRPPTAESTNATYIPNVEPAGNIEDGINSNATLRPDNREWIHNMLNGNNSATVIPKSVDIGQSPGPTTSAPSIPSLPPLQYPPSTPSQQTPVDDYPEGNDDWDDSDEQDDLWAVKPGIRSPKVKSMSRRKSTKHVPELVVQTSTPPTSFRANIPKGSEPATQSRLLPDPAHSRRQAPPVSTSDRARQRSSKFTENEFTWAPRPVPEEVYERLEDWFPEHDLDKPVIEASSGAGSPTAAEYPTAPLLPEKDKPMNGLVKAKKSIRIVAEEHKKRIDRNSRTDNFATNVSRKRSTKLWGSRLEEVTTAQAMAEQQRARFVKPNPESPSGSGGPRRKL